MIAVLSVIVTVSIIYLAIKQFIQYENFWKSKGQYSELNYNYYCGRDLSCYGIQNSMCGKHLVSSIQMEHHKNVVKLNRFRSFRYSHKAAEIRNIIQYRMTKKLHLLRRTINYVIIWHRVVLATYLPIPLQIWLQWCVKTDHFILNFKLKMLTNHFLFRVGMMSWN